MRARPIQKEQVGAKVLVHGMLDPARNGERDKDTHKINKRHFQESAKLGFLLTHMAISSFLLRA